MGYDGDWHKVGEDKAKCRKCSGNQLKWRLWESSDGAHEDIHYVCETCGADWWIEGSDA